MEPQHSDTHSRRMILALLKHTESLASNGMTTAQFGALYEEVALYREALKLDFGEISHEYQLANSLLTLSRLANADDFGISDVRVWLSKYSVLEELFARVKQANDTLIHHMNLSTPFIGT